MQLEVEQKYAIVDAASLTAKLLAIGADQREIVHQSDTYFNHPYRDFAETDEAFRLRRTPGGAFVTYKGPKLDAAAKTRRELELPLAAPDAWPELLAALGFREVATVRKRRAPFRLVRGEFAVEVCLDCVEGLGEFAEIEIVADDGQLAAAQEVLLELAGELGLEKPERRSYLEMLLLARA